MTTPIIIQILSILILMLFALPGTQSLWNRGARVLRGFGNTGIGKFGNSEFRKSDKQIEVKEIKNPGFFTELSKIAAAIF